MNAELRAKLEAQAEKHEIRGQDFANLMKWAELLTAYAGILTNIELGFLEVVDMKGMDNPVLRITPAGEKYVEASQ